jgi:hypothetical protein
VRFRLPRAISGLAPIGAFLFSIRARNIPLVAILAGGASLSACGHTIPAEPSVLQAQGVQRSTQAAAPNEGAIFKNAVLSLPAHDRENVVLFADGQIYSNRAWLKAGSSYLKPTSRAGMFLDQTRSPIAMCDEASFGPCADSGGVAHTWYSAKGDDWDRATVSVPCSFSKLVEGQFAYIYLGGTSGNGSQADFGLQVTAHAPVDNPGQPGQAKGYTLASPGLPCTRSNSSGCPTATNVIVGCDSAVTMTFYVSITAYKNSNYPQLNLNISGGGANVTISRIVPKTTRWGVPCVGCQVKRVTSMTGVQALKTYLGIDNPTASPAPSAPTPELSWQNALESKSGPGDAGAWAEGPSGDIPGGAVASGLLRENITDNANETVGINEYGPSIVIHEPRR